jgi:hypothetical protein
MTNSLRISLTSLKVVMLFRTLAGVAKFDGREQGWERVAVYALSTLSALRVTH